VKTDIHAQHSDWWKWTANVKENFNFKSGWNLARQPAELFEFHHLIWIPAHCPKMATCLLRALKRKRLTKDKLTQIGVIQGNICSLCNSQPETIDHLYFECSYSRYLWALCKLKLGMDQQINLLAEAAKVLRIPSRQKLKSQLLQSWLWLPQYGIYGRSETAGYSPKRYHQISEIQMYCPRCAGTASRLQMGGGTG